MKTDLDVFHESELFDELCRARWRKFRERLTKKERAERAELDARQLADLVDGRPITGPCSAGRERQS